ncbi:osteocalcin [Xenopus laevis]|uniref:Gla domain-containing protein n=2 Tax=Xenopus laevis TaxID=8355 RepID=A0A974D319_XENLA|nr:osteocalcin [Xenopus laevis]OCT83276.1 hypothetical protein XELAEV_18025813mg [Xenopus laevis]
MKELVILSLLVLSVYSLLHKDVKPMDSTKKEFPEDVKVTRQAAHAVIKRVRRGYNYYERYFARMKSPLELKKEQCENYLPCDQLSEWVGFYQAYQKYFGPV